MSGSLSFHSAKKSLLAAPPFVVSPSIPYERATPVAPMRQSGIQHHAGIVDDFLEFRARLLAAVTCEVGFASQAGGARLQSDWCMAAIAATLLDSALRLRRAFPSYGIAGLCDPGAESGLLQAGYQRHRTVACRGPVAFVRSNGGVRGQAD